MSYSSETPVFGLPQWQMSDIISMIDFNNAFLDIDSKAVPNTRKVNGKALTGDISLSPSDVGAVPTTRTVNNKALSTDISLTASDVGAVPTSRTVNGKPLSGDVTLTYSDVGAVSDTTTINGQRLEGNVVIDVESSFLAAYPVGALFFTTVSTNPGTLYGGTWAAWGGGRVPVGVNTADSDFNTVEKTGGKKTERHEFKVGYKGYFGATVGDDENMVQAYRYSTSSYGTYAYEGSPQAKANAGLQAASNTISVAQASSTGDTSATSIVQPYITCYIWKRTT